MIGTFLTVLTLAIGATASAEPKLIGSGESIPRNLASGGGQLASGTGFSLDGAVAEIGVANLSGTGFQMNGGLMNISAQPGTVTSIAAVTKSTGTLQLSWNAPGLDGFIGSVVSGYYRIDSSSDPAHVFDPTIYSIQFATSVVPNTLQTYALTNLLPNTTYYSRVYLANASLVVAETSARSAESTLANLPASPALSGVYATSVTFTWSTPPYGTEGYGISASTTDFASGSVASTMTAGGLVTTLTIGNLQGGTTYFFKLGSFNWQTQGNYTTIFGTVTFPTFTLPVTGLAVSTNPAGHAVSLTWSNPSFPGFSGVLVLVSTNPISAAPANGTAYALGTTLSDGSVVQDTAAYSADTQGGLSLDTTEYFNLYAQDAGHTYSAVVSTSAVLDLPPLAVSELSVSLAGSSATLRWNPVTSSLDGSLFQVPYSPTSWELSKYAIYLATSMVNSAWSLAGVAPPSASSFTVVLPPTGLQYYFKVVAEDAFPGQTTDAAMVIDLSGDVLVVDADQVTRLVIPASLAAVLNSTGNPAGQKIILRVQDRPQDEVGNVIKSVDFGAYLSPSNVPVANLVLPGSGVQVAVHYDVASGLVVPSAVGPAQQRTASAASLPPVSAANAAQELALVYVNGQSSSKLFGSVDAQAQTVAVNTAMTGLYQLQEIARAASFSFDVSQMSNKFITPNGDGLNDTVVWNFDNPNLSAYAGKIFDARGAYVAALQPGPVANSLMWDGKSNGRVVPRGVYLYEIQAEGKTYNGTVVVIR